jgi:hypothetical protein
MPANKRALIIGPLCRLFGTQLNKQYGCRNENDPASLAAEGHGHRGRSI